jgi:hypothetical protein
LQIRSKAGGDPGKYLEAVSDTTAERRTRPARKAGAKRRGVPRPDRRIVQGGIAVGKSTVAHAFSQGLCLCQSSEITPSFFLMFLMGIIAILVLYILYLRICKRIKPVTMAKAVATTNAVTTASSTSEEQVRWTKLPAKLPQMIYFSANAAQRPRSYHSCETCPALQRVQSVCTAIACKNCVDQNFEG